MTVYMLHFTCTNGSEEKEIEANACVIANSIDHAEQGARELIHSRAYNVKELIAYSQINAGQIAELSQVDAMLYLKAEQNGEQRAVIFS